MALPELYQEKEFQRQSFDRNSEFMKRNPDLTARGTRKFNRYWNSDQRLEDEKAFNAAQDAAELAHVQAEAKKRADSWDARIAALREQNAARGAAALNNINASLAAKPAVAPATPSLVLKDAAKWNQVASQYGFKDYNAVAAWQKENGLEADGKFGAASYAKWSQLNPDKVGSVAAIKAPSKPAPAPSANTEAPQNNTDAWLAHMRGLGYTEKKLADGTSAFKNNGTIYYNNGRMGSASGMSNYDYTTLTKNNVGPATSTTPSNNSQAFRWNDFTKAFGLDTFEYDGKTYARYDPDGLGDFAVGQDGKIYHYARNNMLGHNDISKELVTYTMDQPHTGKFKENLQMLNGLMASYRKQGGTMNRINYFQQGGAAPQQQDIKAQVTALVQAAMQGDQKATQQVNKIMEAAKAGDQQAIQIAQIMEQVVKEMQGQAVAAKYGAKLDYLQSLKCGGKTKAKKRQQGGTVCPDCEKVNNKQIISKHQSGGAVGFYRNWTKDEVRKLQNRLAAYGYYDGDLDGIVGSQTIAAVKKFQTEHGVKADGMWGHNTNSQKQFVDASTASKGSYAPTHTTEQGSLHTYEVSGKKMKEQDYYKAVQQLKEQFYADPEAFWKAGGDTAKWREHLYTTPEGNAIMEEFYSATPDDVRKNLGSRVTNRKMQHDQMDSGIREAQRKAAEIAVTKVLPGIASIAAAPAVIMNPLAGLAGLGGAALGGAVGRKIGENLSAGDTSVWTSVDGMGNVASVATPTSEIVVPVTETLGAVAGGYGGWKFGQNVGKPSLDGLWRGPELRVHGKNGPLAPVSQYTYHPRPNYKSHANPNKGKSSKKRNTKKDSKEPHINFENLSQRKANGGSIERIKYFSLV